MEQMPINVVIFGSIPEAALIISLGLILVGIRPPFIKVALIAIIQGVASYYIRKHVGFGLHVILQAATMSLLVWRIMGVSIKLSTLSIIIGVVISSLIETPLIAIIPRLMGISLMEIMTRDWIRVLIFLPQLLIMATLIYVCLKYNFTLEGELNLSKLKKQR
ncbi:hypothetical protein [Alkaliphilus oremlandii]|uniref:Uncharacterized protein n=1 Tax=Alkaliphilus oremlandii (strain OhILAs) TaxID=350688 RepID=A8MJM5_ALKOO|nr:hypothetical protein [Alkaliphilus oremlandii]ABW20007.1 conserved hypothetical protein [Alkaliphilus oremlandii OhILAs]